MSPKRVGCLIGLGVLLVSCSTDATELAAGSTPEAVADTTVPTTDVGDPTTSSTGATTTTETTTTTTTEPDVSSVHGLDGGAT